MAFTYLVLNFVFLAVVLFVFRKYLTKPSKTWWLSLGSLLVLTAVFDNIMIASGFVSYDPEKIIGLYVGIAPIEDFMYAILAAILAPVLWRVFNKGAQETKQKRTGNTNA